MNNFKIFESKHDSNAREIANNLIFLLKDYMGDINLDDDDSINYTLPIDYNEEDFYIVSYNGLEYQFTIEYFICIDSEIESYKIDADAPGDMSESDINIVLYINPNEYPNNVSEIYFNLIYTIRHEYEHLLQVYTDYERVLGLIREDDMSEYSDHLQYLMQPQEIEPQIRGYYLQAKKERKDFSEVVMSHLDKLERNGQVEFNDQKSKEILLNKLINISQELGLDIQ